MAARVTLAGQVGIDVSGVAPNNRELGRTARVALAYLVCERHRPVPRDELAEVVWGEDLPTSWEQLLRGLASKLRTLFGAAGWDPARALTSVLGVYQVHLPPDVTVDVEDASRGLDAAEGFLAAAEAEQAFQAAAAALAVAGRHFLPGASGAWVERRQAELRELRLRGLEALARAEELQGRWSGAVAAAEEAIGLEPFRESAYLRLMAAHAGAGRRGEALRAYERCRRVLASELGVSPSATTEAAYLDLLADEPPHPVPPAEVASLPLPPALLASPGAFLVGREEEIARLVRVLEKAAIDGRQAVFVAGEPGIGKTALVARLARSAHPHGARVLYGRCDEELGVAYQPFAEALGHYVAHCPLAELATHAAAHGGELARLVPELGRRLPGLPDALVTEPEADRYRLFEAVTALVGTASAAAPVVLVLDDLHWATNATLLLLRHLLRSASADAVLVLGTYRQSEIGAGHPLTATLADLRRQPDTVTRMTLGGLDQDGVAAFVQAADGAASGPEQEALARALHAHTAGNPFFVGQLLAHLDETGAVYRREGPWSLYADAEGLEVPEGVKEVVARRLGRMSEAANRALVLASVIGAEFDLELLEAVTDTPDDHVLDAIEEAARAQLVAEVGHGRYRFAHALVRDAIYADLTATRRGRLHRRTGESLESLPGRGDIARLPALAHHFAQGASAGCAAKAADYALAAARHAVAHAAWEDAAALLERGLEGLDNQDPPDLDRRCQLLLLLAETWTRYYDPPRTRAVAFRAVEAAQASGSPENLARAAYWYARAATGGYARPDPADLGRARAALDAAIAVVGDALPALRAKLLVMLARLQGAAPETSEATVREALDLARRSGDPEALGVALADACRPRHARNPLERLALAEELVSAAPPGGWDGWREGHEQRAIARLAIGDRAGFEADAGACERLGVERRFWYYQWIGAVWRATLALLDGRWGEAEALAGHARDVNPDNAVVHVLFARQQFLAHLESGESIQAKAAGHRLIARWPANSMHKAMLARAQLGVGELDEVRRQLEEGLGPGGASVEGLFAADGRGTLPNERWPVTLSYWAEVGARLGEVRAAETLYEALRPYGGQVVIGGMADGCTGAVDRYLGMLAATGRRWDQAEVHYNAALVVEAGMEAPPLMARTRWWLARTLVDRGHAADGARAKDLLAASHAEAARLGMASLAQETGALLNQI